MRDRRVAWRGCAGALLAVLALGATAATAAKPASRAAPEVCKQTGKGTGDWEVAFGRRVILRKANALLAKVRRKGFRRALIEREQCLYEIAIIHLSFDRAYSIALRARRKGLRVSLVQS